MWIKMERSLTEVYAFTIIKPTLANYKLVSRLTARSANFDMHLSLDINFELYSLHPQEKFSLVLATSLVRSGAAGASNGQVTEDSDQGVWRPDGKGRRGLEEDYEYVMYGKVLQAT